jgi:hypothetical protein
MARRDFYERERPAEANRQADQTANETLSSLVDIATPLGPALTSGRLIYQGRYEDAAKEAGKEIAYQAAGGLIGRGVGKAVTVVKAAIKEGKATGKVANEAENALRNIAESQKAREASNFETLPAAERAINARQELVRIGYNENGVSHIFQDKHQLDPLVNLFGSKEEALLAMQREADLALRPSAYQTGAWVSIQVEGIAVSVKGAFINGKFRISTATMRPF